MTACPLDTRQALNEADAVPELNYGLVIENLPAPIGLFAVSADAISLLHVSNAFLDVLGLTRAAAEGRRIEEIFLADVVLSLSGAIRRSVDTHEAVRFKVDCGKVAGRARRCEFVIAPMPGAIGVDLASVTATPYVAPPPIAERARQELFEQLMPINGGVVFVYDLAKARRFHLNDDLARILGYRTDAAMAFGAARLLDLFHPDDAERLKAHFHALRELPDGQFEVFLSRMRHADGEWRWIETRERVFSRGGDGRVRRVLGVASDVSERRRLLNALAGASQALLMSEEQERRRIARELHDSTAQHLVAIDLTLSRLERRMAKVPANVAIITDIRSALGAAHREIRTFSYLLHPPELERAGLEATLRSFVGGFAKRTGLEVGLAVEGVARRLSPVFELALFRVAQEALMNVHKHAAATRVDLRLVYAGEAVSVEVADDGAGMTAEQIARMLVDQTAGVGVAAMKARIDDLGGRFELLPSENGLVVSAMVTA